MAAAAGIGAFVFPLTAPWHLLTVAFASMAAVAAVSGRQQWYIEGAILIVVGLVLLGYMPSPLAAAALSAAALGATGRIRIALAVLLVNLTAAASAQQMMGDFFHRAHLEAAAPAVTAAMALLLASTKLRQTAGAVVGGLLSVAVVWLGNRIATTPDVVLALGAIPITFVAAALAAIDPSPRRPVGPLGVVFLASLATWFWTPPGTASDVWLLLPNAPGSYEAKFFNHYVEALSFAGIDAKKASRPEDIPVKAVVLLPWLTAGFSDDSRLGDLARERRWTMIVGGEHTDMGGIAERIEAMSGRALLRRDLTVPPGNTNDSGPLRMPGFLAWPHETILNRGASVAISTLATKVLLAGDGWWAEPDIKEWLWVGDYLWRPGDRAGRLVLAAVSDINGARWVIVSDNSLFVNQQLFADPRAAKRLLQAATLWPALLHDILLVLVAVVVILGLRPVFVVVIPTMASLLGVLAERPNRAWTDVYLGESGFDERNFNNVLADNPVLIAGRRLIRVKAPVSGQHRLPDGAATVFLLVNGTMEVAGVRLDQCHRLGSLSTSDGAYLMDAQACRVHGKARILIGTPEAAAAIAVSNGPDEAIVILDSAFLSQKAPAANVRWLLKEIGR